MRVERFSDVSRFYDLIEPLLMQREAENNLILGRVGVLRDEPANPEHFFAIVFDAHEPVIAAMMTPPYPLVVSRGSDAAIDALAEYVHANNIAVSEVGVVKEPAHLLAKKLAALRGQKVGVKVDLKIFQIQRVIPPRPASGAMRVAKDDDAELLIQWMEEFARVVGEHAGNREIVLQRLKLGHFYLWEDPTPVSMAGWSGRTPNGVRINAVYTPQEFRGQGYASNCVAALTQLQLETDRRFCFLFTDAANPTSNKIYQQIGYEWVCDCANFEVV